MFKKIFILVLFLLPGLFNNCISQVNVEWFRTYSDGWGKNFVNDFVIDVEGNTYLTGMVSQNSSNSRNAASTVKYNSNGELQWAKLYKGSSMAYAESYSIILDYTGNVYITGTCYDVDSSSNFFVIKYNSVGDIIWTKKYQAGVNTYDWSVALAIDKKNNVFVTGYQFYSPFFWSTLKYDSSGNLLWESRYEGNTNENKMSRAIVTDEKDNVYVSGSAIGIDGSIDFCTIKYNQSGIQQWISFFGSDSLMDIPAQIEIDKNGDVYVLGHSRYNNLNPFYTSLVKYDNNGNELWNVRTDSLGGSDSYYYDKISFKLDSKENICISTIYQHNLCVLKYNSSGAQTWIRKYPNGSEFEYSRGIGIEIDSADNIYACGHARIFGNIEPFIIIKYNSEGNVLWNRDFHVYNDVEFDEGAFIGIDKNNNVYIAGIHVNNNYIIKYSLLKYSQSVGITNISSEIPDNYILYQNYPNPFNPKTVIRYSLIENCFTTLKVYDALGKIVSTLVNENQNAGTYEVDFDGNDLASGVYYYRLSAGNFTQTKRMLLLK